LRERESTDQVRRHTKSTFSTGWSGAAAADPPGAAEGGGLGATGSGGATAGFLFRLLRLRRLCPISVPLVSLEDLLCWSLDEEDLSSAVAAGAQGRACRVYPFGGPNTVWANMPHYASRIVMPLLIELKKKAVSVEKMETD
jgi:hypothetical protein